MRALFAPPDKRARYRLKISSGPDGAQVRTDVGLGRNGTLPPEGRAIKLHSYLPKRNIDEHILATNNQTKK